ncbi:MAG: hypothetical protein ACRD3P_15755, partial [Terriglobales bacterium]
MSYELRVLKFFARRPPLTAHSYFAPTACRSCTIASLLSLIYFCISALMLSSRSFFSMIVLSKPGLL